METLGVGIAPSPSSENARAAERLAWEQRLNGSAKWFYWIAAFSVVNAGLTVSGANLRFIIGMGVTDVVAAIGQRAGGAGVMAALVVTAFVAGLCGLFGYLGLRKHVWVFWVGMLLYALDGAILLLLQDFLSAAFHGWVLFNLFQGVKALKHLKALDAMSPVPVTAKPIA